MRRGLAIVIALTVLSACAAAGAAGRPSGIAGRVLTGPTCPVERIPPDPRCAPRPRVATLRFRLSGSQSTNTVRSARDGSFRVLLAPGNYVVQALGSATSPFPRAPAPFAVRVRPHHMTRITVMFDSGIR